MRAVAGPAVAGDDVRTRRAATEASPRSDCPHEGASDQRGNIRTL